MISNREALVKKNAPRSERHSPEYQMTLRYADWMTTRNRVWTEPDLAGFARYLIARNVERTDIELHLKTIRECYANVARDKHELILGIAASESDDDSQWKVRISEIKGAMSAVATGDSEIVDLNAIYQSIEDDKMATEEHMRLKKLESERKHGHPATIIDTQSGNSTVLGADSDSGIPINSGESQNHEIEKESE